MANNTLKNCTMEAKTDVSDAVAKARAIVQAILRNMLTRTHLSRGARVAKLESDDGSREKADQFVQSVCIAITMQLDTFVDKRMKVL